MDPWGSGSRPNTSTRTGSHTSAGLSAPLLYPPIAHPSAPSAAAAARSSAGAASPSTDAYDLQAAPCAPFAPLSLASRPWRDRPWRIAFLVLASLALLHAGRLLVPALRASPAPSTLLVLLAYSRILVAVVASAPLVWALLRLVKRGSGVAVAVRGVLAVLALLFLLASLLVLLLPRFSFPDPHGHRAASTALASAASSLQAVTDTAAAAVLTDGVAAVAATTAGAGTASVMPFSSAPSFNESAHLTAPFINSPIRSHPFLNPSSSPASFLASPFLPFPLLSFPPSAHHDPLSSSSASPPLVSLRANHFIVQYSLLFALLALAMLLLSFSCKLTPLALSLLRRTAALLLSHAQPVVLFFLLLLLFQVLVIAPFAAIIRRVSILCSGLVDGASQATPVVGVMADFMARRIASLTALTSPHAAATGVGNMAAAAAAATGGGEGEMPAVCEAWLFFLVRQLANPPLLLLSLLLGLWAFLVLATVVPLLVAALVGHGLTRDEGDERDNRRLGKLIEEGGAAVGGGASAARLALALAPSASAAGAGGAPARTAIVVGRGVPAAAADPSLAAGASWPPASRPSNIAWFEPSHLSLLVRALGVALTRSLGTAAAVALLLMLSYVLCTALNMWLSLYVYASLEVPGLLTGMAAVLVTVAQVVVAVLLTWFVVPVAAITGKGVLASLAIALRLLPAHLLPSLALLLSVRLLVLALDVLGIALLSFLVETFLSPSPLSVSPSWLITASLTRLFISSTVSTALNTFALSLLTAAPALYVYLALAKRIDTRSGVVLEVQEEEGDGVGGV
ncbi:hypothetical protein CLOM_g16243 [Closterium sp. NIES-68]|nr:hypothetical protein CLOM_g16243 [Closterium sp. NIES-68]GJP82118.1 hypothetical protein CLOP_g12335 [Closterium sp. NIES-67]